MDFISLGSFIRFCKAILKGVHVLMSFGPSVRQHGKKFIHTECLVGKFILENFTNIFFRFISLRNKGQFSLRITYF